MGSSMKFKEWFNVRGSAYINHRAWKLLRRYGISSSHAIRRIDNCLEGLVNQDCAPTFIVPGIVVRYSPQFFRHLQAAGAEIAVHGYQHVDLKAYPVTDACEELAKAVEVFNHNGIDVHGFRCPYLGCTDELVNAIPEDVFRYSSNKAIYWTGLKYKEDGHNPIVINTLHNLYNAAGSMNVISVPYPRANMLEIPVCLPDDMELIDGLNLSVEDVANVWGQLLDSTYQRGELFTLIFHPELATLCALPFVDILSRSKLFKPKVWVARLCDIGDWWDEKAGFKMEIASTPTGLRLDFTCSPRATILLKGIDGISGSEPWDGSYQRLLSRCVEVPAIPRPFIGVSDKASSKVISFLLNQGYILDTTEKGRDCSIYLDEGILASKDSEVKLIDYIEGCAGPLVRYGRWPNGAKSALSITGDLDALSLIDYLTRIYIT
jgi:peptidoglycan/xylan/chitin deacetylase (PgdA/CDA1 family)